MTTAQKQRIDNLGGSFADEQSAILPEQMQREVDYVRAQQILASMLEKGLVSLPEFNKITELNRKTFSPFLAEIMPENR